MQTYFNHQKNKCLKGEIRPYGHFLVQSIIIIGLICICHIFKFVPGIYLGGILMLLQSFLLPECVYLPILLFYLSFSSILKGSVTAPAFTTYLQLLYSIIYILKHRKFPRKVFVSFVCIFIIIILGSIRTGDIFSKTQISFLISFLFFPLYFKNEIDNLDYKECVRFCVLGILISFVTSLLFAQIPSTKFLVSEGFNARLGITRTRGLYSGDANGFGASVLVGIGLLLSVLVKKNSNKALCGILLGILTVIGLMSLSRGFLLMFIIVGAFYVLYLLFSSGIKHKYLYVFLLFVMAFVILNLRVTKDLINSYSIRIDDSLSRNNVTAGRTDIWKSYVAYLINYPYTLFFGKGLTPYAVYDVDSYGWAAHNTVIQMVFQIGIVGMFIYSIWISTFTNTLSRFRVGKTHYNYFLVVSIFVSFFGMWFTLDRLFYDSFFINVILFFVYLKDTKQSFVKI